MIEKQKGRGIFKIRQLRKGKVVDEFEIKNATTYAGQDYMLAAAFNAGSAISSWFAGLIDNSGFTGGNVSDTMASHTGWTENVNYTQSVRQTWGSGAPASGSITNGTVMTFTMNANCVLAGLFLSSSNTKGGTTGTLWNVATLASPGTKTITSGDVLQVTYTYSLT